MIKSILVPVDFSPVSAAALRYAEAMAAATEISRVYVVHVFTPEVATGNAIVMPDMSELMDQRDGGFRQFLDRIPSPEGVERRSEMLVGFAADKINSLSSDHDLIVMGTHGDSDLIEEVFGSISSEVAQNAECPVLLVPRQAVFRDYDHILYASNSLSLSREAVLKFREFNRLFHARVHFVHINEEDGEHKPGQRERLFAPLFNNPEPEFAFEIDEVTADTVQEGLMTYLKAHPIQLAVMVTRHRGFWANLFHHSDTRQMVLHPETPLLVLHL